MSEHIRGKEQRLRPAKGTTSAGPPHDTPHPLAGPRRLHWAETAQETGGKAPHPEKGLKAPRGLSGPSPSEGGGVHREAQGAV